MTPSLPGTNPNTTPPPPLVSPNQPTPAEKAAIEAMWAKLLTDAPVREILVTLDWLNKHRDLIELAHAGYRVNLTPGVTP